MFKSLIHPRIIYALISFGLLLAIWQLCISFSLFNRALIPPPIKVWLAFWEWLKNGELIKDLNSSLWRMFLGLFIGATLGITIGLLTGRIYKLRLFLNPILNGAKALPPVALLPVLITLFGIGDFSKIFSIAFSSFFPVWVTAHQGTSSIPIEYIRSAKLLTTSEWKIFTQIIFPSSLRHIISGFRVSIAMAFVLVYVSELAGASNGLGYQISNSHLAYRMDRMFAALIVLAAIASLTDFTFNKFIKYRFPWISNNTHD